VQLSAFNSYLKTCKFFTLESGIFVEEERVTSQTEDEELKRKKEKKRKKIQRKQNNKKKIKKIENIQQKLIVYANFNFFRCLIEFFFDFYLFYC